MGREGRGEEEGEAIVNMKRKEGRMGVVGLGTGLVRQERGGREKRVGGKWEGEMDTGTERRATGGIGWEEREGCGNGEVQRQELEGIVGVMGA